ncbi:MAG: alpha/beta hydrolase [Steroidobacteraceae bacterium]|nr:alpha/beta hydrolase [Steroidobacteraceae bacterium]
MTRRATGWLLGSVLVVIILIVAGSWGFATLLVKPTNHRIVLPADFPAATVSIPGDGHAVAGSWRDLGADSPVVLLLHGLRGDRASMVPRARVLLDAGFSVLLIDQQAHGETPGEIITLGWRESKDVRAARDWLRAQAPGRRIAVLGVSLGGAAALLGDQPVGFDAVVIEATYPRLGRALDNRIGIRAGWLRKLLAPLLLVQIEPRLGVTPAQLEPIRNIATLGAPVMIVGGSRDAHTTEEETRELFAAASEPKALWIVEGAAHQDFARFDRAGYEQNVVAFLRRNLAR